MRKTPMSFPGEFENSGHPPMKLQIGTDQCDMNHSSIFSFSSFKLFNYFLFLSKIQVVNMLSFFIHFLPFFVVIWRCLNWLRRL